MTGKVFWAVALFALFSIPAPGAAQSGAVKVTVAARRITLDALVRKLARRSGLTLDVDPADPLSATPLLAYLTDVRADTAASALADLLSTRRAAWRWERLPDKPGEKSAGKSGDENAVSPADFKPGVAYRLRPSSSAKVYAAKARTRIWQDLAGTISAANGENASPDELIALAKDFRDIPRKGPLESFATGQIIPAEALEKHRKWIARRDKANERLAQNALAQLSPADRERLLDGKELRFPSERFDPAFADAVRDAGELNVGSVLIRTADASGNLIEVTPDITAPPTYALYFDTKREAFAVAPSLTVSVEKAVHHAPNSPHGYNGGRSGVQSFGGAEARWRSVLTREWTPDAPETPSPLPDSLPLPKLATRPEQNQGSSNDTYASFTDPLLHLHETAEKSGKRLNILARLATIRGGASDAFSDNGVKTFGAARKALLKERAMPTRWAVPMSGAASDAILLANALTHIWTSGPDKLVSPKYRADFAAATRRDPRHLISLDLLCDAARRLGPDALYSLLTETDEEEEKEKDQAAKLETDLAKALREGGVNEFADFARKHHPLLTLMGANPALRRRIQEEPEINLADPAEIAVRDAFALCDSPIQWGLTSQGNQEAPSPEPTDTPTAPIHLRLFTEDKADAPPKNASGEPPGAPRRRFILRLSNDNGATEYSAGLYSQ